MNLYQRFAQIASIVWHPIFMPIYCFLIMLYCFPYHYMYIPRRIWTISVVLLFLMTCVFPAVSTLILHRLKIVDDMDISQRKQRILPYIIFLFFYLCTFMMFKPKPTPSLVYMEDPILATAILGATLSLIISFFLNNFKKVSMHTTGISGLLGFSIGISLYTNNSMLAIILLALLATGILAASRIILRAHTPTETYWGIFSGLVSQLLAFKMYLSNTIQ